MRPVINLDAINWVDFVLSKHDFDYSIEVEAFSITIIDGSLPDLNKLLHEVLHIVAVCRIGAHRYLYLTILV